MGQTGVPDLTQLAKSVGAKPYTPPTTTDLTTLARASGATPHAPVDLMTLAKQSGATLYTPPAAGDLTKIAMATGATRRTDPNTWDARADGTKKGNGYLGVLARPDGSVMSEYSIADSEHPKLKDAKGNYLDYPTLVPTLTKDEVNTLLNIKAGDLVPQSIKDKAEAHALARLAKGEPVWAQPGEQDTSLFPDLQRAAVAKEPLKPYGGAIQATTPLTDLYHRAKKALIDIKDMAFTAVIPESFVTSAVADMQTLKEGAEREAVSRGANPSIATARTIGALQGGVEGGRKVVQESSTLFNLGLEALGITEGVVLRSIGRNLDALPRLKEAMDAAKAVKDGEKIVGLSKEVVETVERVRNLQRARTVMLGATAATGAAFTVEGVANTVNAPTFAEKALGVAQAAGGAAMMLTGVPGARTAAREASEASGFAAGAREALGRVDEARAAPRPEPTDIVVTPERTQIPAKVEAAPIEGTPARPTPPVDITTIATAAGGTVVPAPAVPVDSVRPAATVQSPTVTSGTAAPIPEPPGGITTRPSLALQVEGIPDVQPLASLEDAGRAVDAIRDRLERAGQGGVSQFPRIQIVNTDTGAVVGHVSYNGRIWEGPEGSWTTSTKEIERNDGRGYGKQPAIPATADVIDLTPPKAERDEHSFSSTQVNLPAASAKAITDLAAAIPDEDLAPDGRAGTTEGNAPHVTLKYGLHTTDVEKVKAVLANEPPITLKTGKTSIFPNGESGSGDVVKIDIDSPDLHRLNAKIAKALEHTDTHPDYTPHITVAYVKAGLGKNYARMLSLQPHTVTLHAVRFSTKDGKIYEIPLTGTPKTTKKPVTPQLPPAGGGTWYVLPSFATGGAGKMPTTTPTWKRGDRASSYQGTGEIIELRDDAVRLYLDDTKTYSKWINKTSLTAAPPTTDEPMTPAESKAAERKAIADKEASGQLVQDPATGRYVLTYPSKPAAEMSDEELADAILAEVGGEAPVARPTAPPAAPAAAPPQHGRAGEPTITYNARLASVEIAFSAKPERAVLDTLKAAGFRWDKTNKIWYQRDSAKDEARAIREVRELLGVTEQPSTEAAPATSDDAAARKAKREALFKKLRDDTEEPQFSRRSREELKAQSEALSAAYDTMPTRSVGGEAVPIYDEGQRLTDQELTDILTPQVRQIVVAIRRGTERMLARLDIPSVDRGDAAAGPGIERVGLLFLAGADGVFVPNQASDRATILINPFEQLRTGRHGLLRLYSRARTPKDVARRVVRTLAHEAAHWFVKGHDADFDLTFQEVLQTLGYALRNNLRTELEDLYADPDQRPGAVASLHPEVARALSIYSASRGRRGIASRDRGRTGRDGGRLPDFARTEGENPGRAGHRGEGTPLEAVKREDVVTLVGILRTYLEDGLTDFDTAWQQFSADFPRAATYSRHFETAWKLLRGEIKTVAVQPEGADNAPDVTEAKSGGVDGGGDGPAGEPVGPAGRPGDARAADVAGEQPVAPEGVQGEPGQPKPNRKPRAPRGGAHVRGGTEAPGGAEAVPIGGGGVHAPSHVDTADLAPDANVAAAESRGEAPRHFVIDNAGALTEGGVVAKLEDNLAAIRLLKALDKEGRLATDAEQAVLARYVGWGHTGLAPVVDLLQEGVLKRDPRLQKARADLEQLLTAAELKELGESTPNAHYSFSDLPRAMWAAVERLGFTGGIILEPAVGTGHFLGTMPGPMMAARRTKIWGIDKEPIAAGIARHLYQDAHIQNAPIQEANLPEGYFDLVISNVPFGKIKIFDPAFTSAERRPISDSIHNYYFGKALDVVRPGGIVAFITSRYTMDSKNDLVRQYIAARANFLGAIRLPDQAFKKTAGTDVVTDVIFLQRRLEGQAATGHAWTESVVNDALSTKNWKGVIEHAVHTNAYYQAHPDQVLGTQDMSGSMARTHQPQYNVSGTVTLDQLLAAVARGLPERIYKASKAPPRKVATHTGADVKQGAFQMDGGKVYVFDKGTLTPTHLTGKALARIKTFIPLRDAYQAVLDVMTARGSDADLAAAQKELRRTYDAFVRQHGDVNLRENRRVIELDPNGGRVIALENIDIIKGAKGRPPTIHVKGLASFFTERTVKPTAEPTAAGTAEEALTHSLAWKGSIDLAYMAGLTGRTQADLATALEGHIYQDPVTQAWLPKDDYLSGDVTTKLAQAQAAATTDARFAGHVTALTKVLPRQFTPEDFPAPFGATWVPLEVYRAFLKDEAKARASVTLINTDTRVKFYVDGSGQHEFLPQGYDFAEWVASALNGELPTIKTKGPNGSTYTDVAETESYRESLKQLRERWAEWWPANDAAADQIVKIYNGMFNREAPYVADGSYLVLPNANPAIVFRPWQKNVVIRTLHKGNTLMAHAVGAGKTYALSAIAGEWKRQGLANKPAIIVPNHLTEQWRRSFLTLYPGARVLVPSKADFTGPNRKRLIASIANNDWDAVVLPMSQFLSISVKIETLKAFIEGQEKQLLADGAAQMNMSAEDFDDLVTRYGAGDKKAAAAMGRGTPRSVKDIARGILTLRARMQKRLNQAKKDAPITFEELGIDGLLVDEAHLFKNLYFSTAKNNIAGLKGSDADRAMDMFLKVRLINEQSKGRNVVFATGTPISNAISELYTMFRYLAQPELDRLGMAGFDSWANGNAEAVGAMEPTPGGGYKERARLRTWTNLRELSAQFRKFADVVTTEDLVKSGALTLPAIKGGRPTVIALDPHPEMGDFMDELRRRIEALKSGKVDPKDDNHLLITTQAGLAAVDLRLVRPHAAFDPNGRIAVAAKEIAARYKAFTPERSTQLIFLDVGVPGAKEMPPLSPRITGTLETVKDGDRYITEGEADTEDARDGEDLVDQEADAEEAMADIARAGTMRDLYGELRQRLVAAGVPDDQIAYVHQARDAYEQGKLFDAMNDGRIRILIASTAKGATGMNVQTKLRAIHHLDVPWRPSDMEQRDGRGLRQGNENAEVEIVRYVTKKSFDEYRWGLLATKQASIVALMKGELTSMDDVDPAQLDMQVAQALASGDPRTLEMLNKEREVKGLQTRYLNYTRRLNSARRAISAGKDLIERLDIRSEAYQTALTEAEAWMTGPHDVVITSEPSRFYGFSDRAKPLRFDFTDAESRKALQAELERLVKAEPHEETEIGEAGPFRVFLGRSEADLFDGKELRHRTTFYLTVKVEMPEHPVIGSSGEWNPKTDDKVPDYRRSLDAYLEPEKLRIQLRYLAERIATTREDMARNQEIATKGFTQADLLRLREQELSDLRVALGIDQRKAAAATPDASVATVEEFAQELQDATPDARRAIWDRIADAGMTEAVRAHLNETLGPEKGTTLQSTLIPGAKEFLEGDVVPTAAELARQFKDSASGLHVLFSPATVSREAETSAGIVRSGLAGLFQRAQRARRVLEQTKKAFDSLYRGADTGDATARDAFLAFTDAIEGHGNLGALSPLEQQFAAWARQALDTRRDLAIKLGLMDNYIDDYFPHEWADPETAKAVFGRRPLQGRESYRKHRTIPSVREGVDLGLEPASWNPVELVLRKLLEMDKSIMVRRLLRQGKRAGTAKFVPAGKKAPEGFVAYPESFGTVYGPRVPEQTFGRVIAGRYYGPRDAVRIVERYLSPGLSGRVAAFDLYRSASNLFVQLKLALSVFHGLTTGLESVVSKTDLALQLATRGEWTAAAKKAAEIPIAPILDIIRGDRWLKEFYASDATALAVRGIVQEVVQAGGGFGWDLFEHANAPSRFLEAIRRGNYPGAAFRAIPALIELQAIPVMSWWVPRLKMAAFHERAEMELRALGKNPDLAEVRRVLGQAWDTIDDRFGQILYRNWFWFNAMKEIGQASLLSLGWNGGSLRLMLGAVPGQLARVGAIPAAGGRGGWGKRPTRRVNTGKDKDGNRVYEDQAEPWLHPRMAWFLSLLVVGGFVNAMYQYLMTGEMPKDARDVVMPRNGRLNSDGSPQRVFLPGYMKDVIAWATHPIVTAMHKISPLMRFMADSIENTNYMGEQYRSEDDPAAVQLKDWLAFTLRELEPISTEKARDTGWESYLGINPAPRSLTYTKAEAKLHAIQDRQGHPTLTPQQARVRAARTGLRSGLAAGTPAGQAQANEAIGSGLLTRRQMQTANRTARETPLQRGFTALTLDDALAVYEVATPDERQSLIGALYAKARRFPRTNTAAGETWARFNKASRLPRTGAAAAAVVQ